MEAGVVIYILLSNHTFLSFVQSRSVRLRSVAYMARAMSRVRSTGCDTCTGQANDAPPKEMMQSEQTI